ncbi:hypothetical protein Cus16_0411 [Curtobacterium sp. ER1/6]|nr:hypothetical protein Cus16_0411 [Curtobacterium sp. ER1/6]
MRRTLAHVSTLLDDESRSHRAPTHASDPHRRDGRGARRHVPPGRCRHRTRGRQHHVGTWSGRAGPPEPHDAVAAGRADRRELRRPDGRPRRGA